MPKPQTLTEHAASLRQYRQHFTVIFNANANLAAFRPPVAGTGTPTPNQPLGLSPTLHPQPLNTGPASTLAGQAAPTRIRVPARLKWGVPEGLGLPQTEPDAAQTLPDSYPPASALSEPFLESLPNGTGSYLPDEAAGPSRLQSADEETKISPPQPEPHWQSPPLPPREEQVVVWPEQLPTGAAVFTPASPPPVQEPSPAGPVRSAATGQLGFRDLLAYTAGAEQPVSAQSGAAVPQWEAPQNLSPSPRAAPPAAQTPNLSGPAADPNEAVDHIEALRPPSLDAAPTDFERQLKPVQFAGQSAASEMTPETVLTAVSPKSVHIERLPTQPQPVQTAVPQAPQAQSAPEAQPPTRQFAASQPPPPQQFVETAPRREVPPPSVRAAQPAASIPPQPAPAESPLGVRAEKASAVTEPPSQAAPIPTPSASPSPAVSQAAGDAPLDTGRPLLDIPAGFTPPAEDAEAMRKLREFLPPTAPGTGISLPRRPRPVPLQPIKAAEVVPEAPVHNPEQAMSFLERLNRMSEVESAGLSENRSLSLAELMTWEKKSLAPMSETTDSALEPQGEASASSPLGAAPTSVPEVEPPAAAPALAPVELPAQNRAEPHQSVVPVNQPVPTSSPARTISARPAQENAVFSQPPTPLSSLGGVRGAPSTVAPERTAENALQSTPEKTATFLPSSAESVFIGPTRVPLLENGEVQAQAVEQPSADLRPLFSKPAAPLSKPAVPISRLPTPQNLQALGEAVPEHSAPSLPPDLSPLVLPQAGALAAGEPSPLPAQPLHAAPEQALHSPPLPQGEAPFAPEFPSLGSLPASVADLSQTPAPSPRHPGPQRQQESSEPVPDAGAALLRAALGGLSLGQLAQSELHPEAARFAEQTSRASGDQGRTIEDADMQRRETLETTAMRAAAEPASQVDMLPVQPVTQAARPLPASEQATVRPITPAQRPRSEDILPSRDTPDAPNSPIFELERLEPPPSSQTQSNQAEMNAAQPVPSLPSLPPLSPPLPEHSQQASEDVNSSQPSAFYLAQDHPKAKGDVGAAIKPVVDATSAELPAIAAPKAGSRAERGQAEADTQPQSPSVSTDLGALTATQLLREAVKVPVSSGEAQPRVTSPQIADDVQPVSADTTLRSLLPALRQEALPTLPDSLLPEPAAVAEQSRPAANVSEAQNADASPGVTPLLDLFDELQAARSGQQAENQQAQPERIGERVAISPTVPFAPVPLESAEPPTLEGQGWSNSEAVVSALPVNSVTPSNLLDLAPKLTMASEQGEQLVDVEFETSGKVLAAALAPTVSPSDPLSAALTRGQVKEAEQSPVENLTPLPHTELLIAPLLDESQPLTGRFETGLGKEAFEPSSAEQEPLIDYLTQHPQASSTDLVNLPRLGTEVPMVAVEAVSEEARFLPATSEEPITSHPHIAAPIAAALLSRSLDMPRQTGADLVANPDPNPDWVAALPKAAERSGSPAAAAGVVGLPAEATEAGEVLPGGSLLDLEVLQSPLALREAQAQADPLVPLTARLVAADPDIAAPHVETAAYQNESISAEQLQLLSSVARPFAELSAAGPLNPRLRLRSRLTSEVPESAPNPTAPFTPRSVALPAAPRTETSPPATPFLLPSSPLPSGMAQPSAQGANAQQPPSQNAAPFQRQEQMIQKALASPGHRDPLPLSVRALLAPVLGRELGEVQLLSNAAASEATAAAAADALAVGDVVLLSPGQDLASPRGLGLLAHELTHVLRSRDPNFVPAAARPAPRSQAAAAQHSAVHNLLSPSFAHLPAGADEEGLAEYVEGQVRSRFQAAALAQVSPNAFAAAAAAPESPWGNLPAPWEPMPIWDAPSAPTPQAAARPTAVPVPRPTVMAKVSSPGRMAASQAVSAQAASSSRSDTAPAAAPLAMKGPPTGSDPNKSNRSSPDLDRLAQQIYGILKRRLATEVRREH